MADGGQALDGLALFLLLWVIQVVGCVPGFVSEAQAVSAVGSHMVESLLRLFFFLLTVVSVASWLRVCHVAEWIALLPQDDSGQSQSHIEVIP